MNELFCLEALVHGISERGVRHCLTPHLLAVGSGGAEKGLLALVRRPLPKWGSSLGGIVKLTAVGDN